MNITILARLFRSWLETYRHVGDGARRWCACPPMRLSHLATPACGLSQRAMLLVLLAASCLFACSTNVAEDGDIRQIQQKLVTTAIYQINSGGGAVSPFAADQAQAGGNTSASSSAVSTSGVVNAAPAAVYQSERYGKLTYSFGSLTPSGSYTVRLHFAEVWFTAPRLRQFNVLINGVQVLTKLDIFATVGSFKALVIDFTTSASSTGQITIQYVSVSDNAKSSGIEILSNNGAVNQAPTVAIAAAGSPNPTAGTTSALSVLGADDGGEANLIYTWSTTGTPPGTVTFSANGSTAAKNTTATFGHPGNYALAVTIQDAGGLSATSSLSVGINQTFTSISVTPATAQIAASSTQQYTASARDQFGSALITQPAVSWAVTGGGTINTSGLFSARSVGGPFTVSATSGGKSGSASITVTSGGTVSYATDFNLTESPISEGGVWTHLGLDWTQVKTGSGRAFGTQSGGGYNDSYAHLSGFPPDVEVTTVIYLDPSIVANYNEAEIHLRWSDSAHVARGYECNLNYQGSYAEIVRWNGPLGDYTFIGGGQGAGGGHAPVNGSVFKARIQGNIITTYLDGVLLQTADITAVRSGAIWTDGNPGMGFYNGDSGKYGFQSYSVVSL